jgi:hypothetical protein
MFIKARAGTELLAAVEAVSNGSTFLSEGLDGGGKLRMT